MFEKFRYRLEAKRAVKAGRRIVSSEQAVKDYEKYRSLGLSGSYDLGAIHAGKSLHVLLDEKGYKLIHDGRSRSCYFLPETSILESEEGDRRQCEGKYLPGKEFYQ